jgi:hypothetical protein
MIIMLDSSSYLCRFAHIGVLPNFRRKSEGSLKAAHGGSRPI